MLGKPRKTRKFRDWLYERLSTLFPSFHKEITHLARLIDTIHLLDLDPALDIIAPRYSATGRPSRDPLAMLRAMVCASSLGIQSITKLVSLFRSSPVLAACAGFDPDDIPGVGTFYDFIYRLWGEDKTHFARRKRQSRSYNNKDIDSFSDGPISKADERFTETLARAVMDNSFFLDPESSIIVQIFDRCAVAPSEEMGLVQSPGGEGVLLSGDGTLVESGASPSGIKACDCKSKGIHRCDCPRRFSDPDARFGRDAHKDEFVFGYNIYTLVAITSSGPLPVAFACQGANTNDSVMSLLAMNSYNRCRKLRARPAARMRIEGFIGDGAHDTYACYKAAAYLGALPFIPLIWKGRVKTLPICSVGWIVSRSPGHMQSTSLGAWAVAGGQSDATAYHPDIRGLDTARLTVRQGATSV